MRGRRVLPVLAAVAALAAGCGGDESDQPKGNPAQGGVEPTAVSTCMSEHGFAIQPAAADVAARSASGVEFQLTFYRSPEAARTAAARRSGRSAVENAVVHVTGQGSLSKDELAAIRTCIRESE